MFFNYIGFWETSLLQGGPVLYYRAELHYTALKGDMWHIPLSNPQSTPKASPRQKRKSKLLFSDPILNPSIFLDNPKKGLFCYWSFYPHWSRKSVSPVCWIFLHSVVATCCLPIMELQFLQIKFNPIKLVLFHKLFRHVFLCIGNGTNPEKLNWKKMTSCILDRKTIQNTLRSCL